MKLSEVRLSHPVSHSALDDYLGMNMCCLKHRLNRLKMPSAASGVLALLHFGGACYVCSMDCLHHCSLSKWLIGRSPRCHICARDVMGRPDNDLLAFL